MLTSVFISQTEVEFLHCGAVHGSLDSQHVQLFFQTSSAIAHSIKFPSRNCYVKTAPFKTLANNFSLVVCFGDKMCYFSLMKFDMLISLLGCVSVCTGLHNQTYLSS